MGERLLSDPPLLSAVVISWNSAADLRRCLEALARQTVARELIVVDNASTDDSVAIASAFADRILRNDTNLGFAAAANQGIAAARARYVLLLNPDCFLEPGYCSSAIEELERAGTDYGMVTGKLLLADTPALVDSKGIRMTRSGRHLDIDQGRPDDGARSPQEVFGVSGAAAIYRRSFLDDVATHDEVFDADFFSYREDADLAWRGRLLGWRALYVPAAVAHHVRRVTPERRRALPAFINMHSVKNRFLLRLKNEGAWLAFRNAPFELPRDLLTLGAVLTIERTSLPAFTWLWRNRRRVMTKRREIQRRRKVSDRVLARWFR